MLIDLLESSKAIGLCPMGKKSKRKLHHISMLSRLNSADCGLLIK